MNTNTKYYTPDIEDFHVGFEFEFLNDQNEWIFSNDFSLDFVDDDTDTISEVESFLEASKIRVKNLCREDIESLGWVYYDEKRDGGTLIFQKDELDLYYRGDNKLTPSRIIRIGNIFTGEIKNKNELQKLMVQLNIKE